MNHITSSQRIKEETLDQGMYFQSLLREIHRCGLFEDKQLHRIQSELIELLTKQTNRYTNEESSSVRVEVAGQLLQSITYSLGIALKEKQGIEEQIALLKEEKLAVLFYRSFDLITEYNCKSKEILSKLQKTARDIHNIAYQDTLLHSIPDFFHNYNMEFAAYDIPCSMDYPLCSEVRGLLGAEYIYEYLRRLSLEHQFLARFSNDMLNQLLISFHEEAEELLLNLYELLLINTLGCILAGKPAGAILLDQEELRWLQQYLEQKSPEQLSMLLYQSYEELCREYELEEAEIDYGRTVISELSLRIQGNLRTATLNRLFVTTRLQKDSIDISFIEGKPMEDEQLRDLIESINSCYLVTDKISFVKERVHSLIDLMELLDVCFYEEDYDKVFKLLSEAELNLLKSGIPKSVGLEEASEYEPEKEWQIRLLSL